MFILCFHDVACGNRIIYPFLSFLNVLMWCFSQLFSSHWDRGSRTRMVTHKCYISFLDRRDKRVLEPSWCLSMLKLSITCLSASCGAPTLAGHPPVPGRSIHLCRKSFTSQISASESIFIPYWLPVSYSGLCVITYLYSIDESGVK